MLRVQRRGLQASGKATKMEVEMEIAKAAAKTAPKVLGIYESNRSINFSVNCVILCWCVGVFGDGLINVALSK